MTAEGLIKEAVGLGATHIHLVSHSRPMARVHGHMMPLPSHDLMVHSDLNELLISICSKEQYEALETVGELNFGYSIPSVGRFRINVLKQRGTYAISIRIHKILIPDQEVLDIPKQVFDALANQTGLFLVTGQSGSGKSTTIAAILRHILNEKSVHVITVESPIEYLLKHDQGIVLQRDVGIDCQSIAQGLEGAMLHDPDVVMISEIEDDHTLDLALKLAESGKLVVAGYATKNAITALERMLLSEHEAIRRHQLSSSLLGILAQQLVPKSHSKEDILVCELLLVNSAIRMHIQSNQLSEIQNSLVAGRKQGMIAMDAHLFERYEKSQIDVDTLYQFCQDKEYIRRLEKSKGLGKRYE